MKLLERIRRYLKYLFHRRSICALCTAYPVDEKMPKNMWMTKCSAFTREPTTSRCEFELEDQG